MRRPRTRTSRAKAAVAWVPWTDRRLQQRSGYAAGVATPGWYRHVFRHPGPEGVARFFVGAAGALREHGLAASPDHLIAASRLADALAAIRGRPRSGLAEVLDSASAVLSLAADEAVAGMIDELTVGKAVGDVPAAAPQVPLARDVSAAQKAARLVPRGERRQVEIDLRTTTGLRRSHLLHRLNILGVDWGTLEAGRGSRSTFRETWSLAWDPVMSVRLVECAGYGTTRRTGGDGDARRTGRRRRLALLRPPRSSPMRLLADLPDGARAAAGALGTLAATSPDVADLIDALVPLASVVRYGDVRGSDSVALTSVVDEIIVRVVAGLELACRHLDDEGAAAMIERLSGAARRAGDARPHGSSRRSSRGARQARRTARDSWAGARQGDTVAPRRGDLGRRGGSQRFGRALSPGTPAAEGARFVEGFLAGSGTVLVHDADLLGIVDPWISTMANDAFIDTVALLRRTFGSFEPAERRQLGVLVTTTERRPTPTFGADVDDERAAAGIATVRLMLGLEAP